MEVLTKTTKDLGSVVTEAMLMVETLRTKLRNGEKLNNPELTKDAMLDELLFSTKGCEIVAEVEEFRECPYDCKSCPSFGEDKNCQIVEKLLYKTEEVPWCTFKAFSLFEAAIEYTDERYEKAIQNFKEQGKSEDAIKKFEADFKLNEAKILQKYLILLQELYKANKPVNN